MSPVLRLLGNVIFHQVLNKNVLYLDVNIYGVSKSFILTLASDSAATRHVYTEGCLQHLLQPHEVWGLKGLKPSTAARNHNSEAGKNMAFSL